MQYTSPAVYEYISKQTGDPIIERKTCEVSGTRFSITQKDLDFYDKISPTFNGKKYHIPTPRLCPEERQRRRLLFRNERKLYRRKCDISGSDMIAMYSPDCLLSIIDKDIRWSDRYEGLDYQREIDFEKEVVKQYKDLFFSVPSPNLIGSRNENSAYVNYETDEKSCYLTFGGHRNYDCMYGTYYVDCKDCVDGYRNFSCQSCYRTVDCFLCFGSQYLQSSKNCTSIFLGLDLENCIDCIACVGLRNAQYCVLNKQYSREEYLQIRARITDGYKRIMKDFKSLVGSYGLKPQWDQSTCENCIGTDLTNSKNAILSTLGDGVCDCRYGSIFGWCNDVYDVESVALLDLGYEVISSGSGDKENRMKNVFFSGLISESENMMYCYNCFNSKACFLCVGLRNAQYCIFNKKYTKEEYETLVPQIIQKMQAEGTRGEFFSPSVSPFGYNETVAQEYYPLTREEALARGYKRQDKNYDPVVPAGVEVLKGDQIPTDPNSIDESILKKILVCEVSGRPYRIIRQELAFYQTHNLPLPRKHPDIRHAKRMKKRPGRTLYLRNCDKTGEEILSIYPPEYEGKVYSEQAYQQEVYG